MARLFPHFETVVPFRMCIYFEYTPSAAACIAASLGFCQRLKRKTAGNGWESSQKVFQRAESPVIAWRDTALPNAPGTS